MPALRLAGDKGRRYNPLSPPPLDSGPVSGYGACFHSNRSCRLLPAHQGMKTVALIRESVCGSFATHTPPLDSRLRGNDEWRGLLAHSNAV